ncbi:MAG: hypothetical protein IPH18_16010 [Chitinophagaceae bacterium]|nr:hypothetical protein [Chitinophagaceae bacterium]MBK8952191.1 hypothetical protein [Chitinophagaceae bacterium]
MTYGKLITLLHESIEASGIAYRNYISGGKTFRFAEELKRYNDKITLLIKENSQLLSPPLQEHAAGLLHHYNVWTEKWIQLAEAMNPGPDDIFVFANEVTFPKQAAIRIEEEYWIIKAVLNPPD